MKNNIFMLYLYYRLECLICNYIKIKTGKKYLLILCWYLSNLTDEGRKI